MNNKNIYIIILIVIIILLVFRKYNIMEGFVNNDICQTYFDEFKYLYPNYEDISKHEFLGWCRSYARRNVLVPSYPDAKRKFAGLHEYNKTVQQVKNPYYMYY